MIGTLEILTGPFLDVMGTLGILRDSKKRVMGLKVFLGIEMKTGIYRHPYQFLFGIPIGIPWDPIIPINALSLYRDPEGSYQFLFGLLGLL